MNRSAIGFGLLVLALPLGTSGRQAAEAEAVLRRWQESLQGIQQQLLEHQWEASLRASEQLLADLADRLKSGEGSARLLATAVAQQAVAEAGLGRLDAAAWHFQVAQNMNPDFRGAGLSTFGAVGHELGRHRLRELGQVGGTEPVEQGLPAETEIRPPTILESPFMVFRGSREVLEAFPKDLRVEFVVDATGKVREPVVLGSLINPGPVLVSLEVLRDWRFEPARIGEQPIPTLFVVDLPLTRRAVERARERLRQAGREEPR